MTELEKVKSTALTAANKAVKAADKAVSKGKALVETASLMRRHEKALQQLGALVYSLNKRGEENTLLINKYIETVERLEQKIKGNNTEAFVTKTDECPHCGQRVLKNAVFCRGCGERLS